jgi:PIN domain nuclease of toxin-antitoxin system
VTVLDTYAVVAYLRAESAADSVATLLRGQSCLTTATALAEIVDRMVRLDAAHEDDVITDLAELGLLDAIAVDSRMALAAGRLRARHYHRTRRAVSLADCVAASAARTLAEPLATSDRHLLDLCHDEGIATTVLPGSDGSVWMPG